MRYASVVSGVVVTLLLLSCAPRPVLDKSILEQGDRNVNFDTLRANPGAYKGKIFILGGNIVDLKLLPTAAQLEAIYVPVDQYGYFEPKSRQQGRFIALLPKDGEMMDPVEFSKGRWVTLAAEFVEVRQGKIEQMDYVYPVFLIKQVNLWPRESAEYYGYVYPPTYYYGPAYDPWYYPYHYPYPYPYPYYRSYRQQPYHYRLTPPRQDGGRLIQ